MALKFLNKKGWHTGSLRNIENVWKAEQKQEAEQRKLEELRKQIHEEREREEFRLLQEQAGIAPRQERLEFLYDSGLAVGKTSSEGFKALEAFPSADNSAPASAPPSASASEPSSSKQSAVPGALFEDKPQSANDAWRKLHSDPLLMIRQREQEALARIKNNPVKMAMIRKSVKLEKKNDESHDGERQKVKSKHKKHSSSKHYSDSESDGHEVGERKRRMKHKKKEHKSDDNESNEERGRKKKVKNEMKEYQDSEEDSGDRGLHHEYESVNQQRHRSPVRQNLGRFKDDEQGRRGYEKSKHDQDSDEDSRDRTRNHRHSHRHYESEKQQHSSPVRQFDRYKDVERMRSKYDKSKLNQDSDEDSRDRTRHHRHSHRDYESGKQQRSSPVRLKSDRDKDGERTQYEKSKHEEYRSDHHKDNDRSHQTNGSKHTALPPRSDSYRRRGRAPQLSEEERAARLREMQMDGEVHEEQRWKRLKRADEDDAREASQADGNSRGKSFLHSVQKSVYGAEKGGSSTIEESVRRRTHFLQGRTADEGNAFRR